MIHVGLSLRLAVAFKWPRTRLAPLNPLRCTGTSVPPNLLLAAKLIVLCLIIKGYVSALPGPFLPLLPIFDQIPRPGVFRFGLQVTFWIAAVGLLLNRWVRTCSLLAGLVLIIGPLAARSTYTNGQFFCACMLLLIGLYHARQSIWLLRAQFVIMYFGSGLNKLFEPDWRNGQYIDYWLGQIIESGLYIELASWLPPGMFAFALGWGTIAFEFGLAIALALPRLQRTGVWTAILFHTSVLILAYDFSVFFGALLAGLLVFADWPERGTVDIRYSRSDALADLLRRASGRIHFDDLFRWQPIPQDRLSRREPLRLILHGKTYTGLAAFNVWLLLNPLTYFIAVGPIVGFSEPNNLVRDLTVLFAVVWFFPATSYFADLLRRNFARKASVRPDARQIA